ncbi:MAG: translation initiation factor IF-2 [Alphaproteobacteria bacterium]|nr:translation initiation factor IF-2 [Alphaproteobacteria bacterium]
MARRPDQRRRDGKITISQALNEHERVRSLASVRRAREREKRLARLAAGETTPEKIVRDVIVPETITVQELAARMAERGVDVIKVLMKVGVMATINQQIDGDTAELVVADFGHRVKRVSKADVEIGIGGEPDIEAERIPRPPIVTVMGHVDHGKTSLLDALRQANVAAGEAGGITQHIGAYQVATAGGQRLTFLDTPGHEAFTAMRARGANVTDIVVLVVAADDGVMPQTVEAINHAQAAGVPLVVAINKMDKADADPDRVRRELLQHGVVVESMGGQTQAIEISAAKRTNLDRLEEAILLQSDLLDLRANPHRAAQGAVVESRVDRGRGVVATALIQSGTLHVGDIIVAGGEWGRVRALVDDRGATIESAGPATPVEVIGLNGLPLAGEALVGVDNEARAREVAEFRSRRARQERIAGGPATLEQMFTRIQEGVAREVPIVVKADVHGSLEAILSSVSKLRTSEVGARILHAGVGGINESDVDLAQASEALVIGFNVRANKQARELARQRGTELRYYSVIYELVDDIRAILSGMLAPSTRERFLGNAEVLQVFAITKVGRVAGCRVTEGVVRRAAKVRLLRDSVVIYEGSLSTLKRFKDEVREVREGNECGVALERFQDMQPGDVIEAFDIEQVARTL